VLAVLGKQCLVKEDDAFTTGTTRSAPIVAQRLMKLESDSMQVMQSVTMASLVMMTLEDEGPR